MNRTTLFTILFFFLATCGIGAAFGGTPVDQGAPGNQGAWPMKLMNGADAGITVSSKPYPCANPRQVATNISTDGGFVPGDGGLAGRAYIVVTNSSQNASGNVKCTLDGTYPVFALGNSGDYLTAGQSIKYPTTATINCISDTGGGATDGGGVWVLTTECR